MLTSPCIVTAIGVLAGAGGFTGRAGQAMSSATVSHDHGSQTSPPATPMAGAHAHGAPVPAITFAELERTAQELAAARRATEKYQDVRTAEAAGYRPVGPNVPGMGIHYVRQTDLQHFSITDPPILLYERDAAAPGSLRLVGVSYLLVAPGDADGQPVNPPFPKALTSWHKHNNVCVLPDNSASVELSETQCTSRGGRFTAETSWMMHAWIWKDSPAGVFSPTNPLVKGEK
jgi:hypothetical protein